MKIRNILIMVLPLIILSCNNKRKASFEIKGVISDEYCKSVTLEPSSVYADDYTCELDPNGSFCIKTENLKAGIYYLRLFDYFRIPIYIDQSGVAEIQIEYNDKKFDVKYSGTSSELSNILYENDTKINKIKSDFDKSEIKSGEQLKCYQNLYSSLVKVIEDEKSLPDNIKQLRKKEIKYILALKEYFFEQDNEDLGKPIDKNFGGTYMSGITFDDPDLNENANVISLVRILYNNQATTKNTLEGKKELADKLHAFIELVKENVRDRRLVELSLFKNLNRSLLYLKLNEYAPVLDVYKKEIHDESLLKQLTEISEALIAKKEKLSAGKPAPEWSAKDKDGNVVSLSDFKGKYVYVDVWATWCKPCVGEIPHLHKLIDHYKNKNIVFISYSLDNKQKRWEKFISKEESKSIHVIDKDGFDSPIKDSYMFRGIPRFILIDKDGRIIDIDAPRPSSKEIYEILDKYL
ncbi:TlpA family protein disulfide reductase [Ancylomarina sp. YFZ004]